MIGRYFEVGADGTVTAEMTPEAVYLQVGHAIFREVAKYPAPDSLGAFSGRIGWGATPIQVGRVAVEEMTKITEKRSR